LTYIPRRRFCLVVDDDNELLRDYTTLCKNISDFVTVQHTSQEQAIESIKKQEYDCIIVDNDSFKIGEYRGLQTVEKLVSCVEPDKIIYTSAIPDDKMKTQASALGVNFVEKGHWRKLENLLGELFRKHHQIQPVPRV
jgi:FixJ family two-component response regulator